MGSHAAWGLGGYGRGVIKAAVKLCGVIKAAVKLCVHRYKDSV
jgi:hypothetical protein